MNKLPEILKDLNVGNVSERIRWFVDNTPYRIAGSEDEAKAAQYIVDCLKAYGVETKTDIFSTFNSYPQYASLEIISPQRMNIEALPCAHIVSTAREGGVFELVYVGSGCYSDYENIDATGKIVLVEVSYSPPVPEKARIAYEKGAAGIMCMNWGNEERVICNRGLKAVWGNPTEETVKDIPQLIGVSITRPDGMYLKGLCQSGEKVMIRLAAIADTKWSKINQPLGILRGNGKSDEFIVIGSHLDAWQPGVTCNATGNAAVLELCRVLCQHKADLDRDIWFVFWNGHEIAEAAGSTWFVDHYWDQLNKQALAYINVDSPGLKEAVLYEIKAADELADFVYDTVRKVLPKTVDLKMCKLPKIGDQSFFGVGVPAVASRMNYTEEYIKSSNGVTLGWWNHTSADDYDKYSPENIEYDLHALSALIYGLSTATLVPYTFERKFADIEKKLKTIMQDGPMGVDLADLNQSLIEVKDLVLAIERKRDGLIRPEQITLYNRFMISVSRLITNVFQTYADKYQQDSYGNSRLTAPIPLFADLERLDAKEADSFAYGMIETQLIKNKNRITDALARVTELAQLYALLLFPE